MVSGLVVVVVAGKSGRGTLVWFCCSVAHYAEKPHYRECLLPHWPRFFLY